MSVCFHDDDDANAMIITKPCRVSTEKSRANKYLKHFDETL